MSTGRLPSLQGICEECQNNAFQLLLQERYVSRKYILKILSEVDLSSLEEQECTKLKFLVKRYTGENLND